MRSSNESLRLVTLGVEASRRLCIAAFLMVLASCTSRPLTPPVVIVSSNVNEAFNRVELTDQDPEKTELLCRKWTLEKMYMIDENGGRSEFPQGPMTIEFRRDHTYAVEMEDVGIVTNGTWEVDGSFSAFTLAAHSLNGVELEDQPIHLNEVIALSQHELRYTYEDPVFGMTFLLEFNNN